MNPQIKKLIHKISKKYSNSSVIDNSTNLRRRKFSFFRNSFSHNKLSLNSVKDLGYRNSVDIAEIQQHNEQKKSLAFERNCSLKVESGNCKEIINYDNQFASETKSKFEVLKNIGNQNNSSECQDFSSLNPLSQLEDTKSLMINDTKVIGKTDFSNVTMESNINNNIINSSNSADTLKYIVRKIFNYPHNFYICLSYIITVFLLLSTLYVAYQVDRLETNLVRLIEKNHMKNLEKNPNLIPDLQRNRQLLISQLEKLSQLMKTIQRKLS